MDLFYKLCLPRDSESVPVVRHLIADSFRFLGVEQQCLDEIELAVTEACTNVLRHSQDGNLDYEVGVFVRGARCELSVAHRGAGFEHDSRGRATPPPSAEGGRGIYLMRFLVDELHYETDPERGTVVRLVKELALEEGSPLRRFGEMQGHFLDGHRERAEAG